MNIYLYQAVPNVALRNADLPTRASGGDLVQRPVAALDLNYLFTFSGADESSSRSACSAASSEPCTPSRS